MKIGNCAGVESAAAAARAGFDFIEVNVQSTFHGQQAQEPDFSAARAAALPLLAANCLIPGALKVVGPAVDRAALRTYLSYALARAASLGTRLLVFGSGAARMVPPDWSPDTATQQLIDFSAELAKLAAEHSVRIALEPLCRKECNIVNSIGQALHIIHAVNNPSLGLLLDLYHAEQEGDTPQTVANLGKTIFHVHLADGVTRAAPTAGGKTDYRRWFGVLRAGGYDGRLSVEATNFDVGGPDAAAVVAFIRKQWQAAAAP